MPSKYNKPLPRITDDTRPFWEGCKRHEIMIQRCSNCGTYRFPPRPMCSKCNSVDSEWSKVDGVGEVFSFMVVPDPNTSTGPARFWPEDEYPISVVIVELANTGGVHIVSNIVECKPESIKIGMPVSVVFQDINEQITLPMFKPA